MKKVIIFGGSGFLGRNLIKLLLAKKYLVTNFDISVLEINNKNYKMIQGDVLDVKSVNKAVKNNDVVFNLAGKADLNDAYDKSKETAQINIIGNINILEASVLNKIKRFIYASSVYVSSREGGFYKCSKIASENYVKEFKKIHNLNYTIIRFGSLYGPDADTNNGLRNIIDTVLIKKKIQYKGDIDTTREYVHVHDASLACINLMKDKYKNKIFLVTGLQSIRVNELLEMIREIMNLPKNSIKFIKNKYLGHYIRTPYSLEENLVQKYVPDSYVDLGQGILDLVNERKNKR